MPSKSSILRFVRLSFSPWVHFFILFLFLFFPFSPFKYYLQAQDETPLEIAPPSGAGEPPQAQAQAQAQAEVPVELNQEKQQDSSLPSVYDSNSKEENKEEVGKIEIKPNQEASPPPLEAQEESVLSDNNNNSNNSSNESAEEGEVSVQKVAKKKTVDLRPKRKKRWEELAQENDEKVKDENITFKGQNDNNNNNENDKKEDPISYSPPSTRDLVPEETKGLTLGSAIEQGLRENSDQKIRAWKNLIIELNDKDNRDKFWLPQSALVLQTDNQRLGRIWSDHDQKNSQSDTVPTGKFGLEIKDYTVFNWGKDYLSYLNTKGQLKRQKESLEENRIILKQQIIDTYFRLVKVKNIEYINKEHVRQASYIYRIDKERASLGQTGRQNYYQSRGQYLLVQQEYNLSRIETHDVDKEMALLIGDEANTIYAPSQTLKYQEMTLPYNKAIEIALSKNPDVSDKKEAFIEAKRNKEISDKENLPLPKLSISLGSYTSTFSSNSSSTRYSTDTYGPGGKNIELKASINMSWAITGEGGFFNSRNQARSYYLQSIAEEEYKHSSDRVKNQVKQYYNKIQEYEKQMDIMLPLVSNARKQYDETLGSYMRKQTPFLQLKDALNNLKYAEINFENLKYDHLKSKIKLAQILGIDDLPGESFETLLDQKNKD